MRNDSDLCFTCSLIEYIGRERKLERADVVDALGECNVRRIYSHADVLHCEPIASVTDVYTEMAAIGHGEFDNVASARYSVPDYWAIGKVYERLIEDVASDDVVATLFEVYHSWISTSISNYNTDFYYQSRGYIAACYQAGEVLP